MEATATYCLTNTITLLLPRVTLHQSLDFGVFGFPVIAQTLFMHCSVRRH